MNVSALTGAWGWWWWPQVRDLVVLLRDAGGYNAAYVDAHTTISILVPAAAAPQAPASPPSSSSQRGKQSGGGRRTRGASDQQQQGQQGAGEGGGGSGSRPSARASQSSTGSSSSRQQDEEEGEEEGLVVVSRVVLRTKPERQAAQATMPPFTLPTTTGAHEEGVVLYVRVEAPAGSGTSRASPEVVGRGTSRPSRLVLLQAPMLRYKPRLTNAVVGVRAAFCKPITSSSQGGKQQQALGKRKARQEAGGGEVQGEEGGQQPDDEEQEDDGGDPPLPLTDTHRLIASPASSSSSSSPLFRLDEPLPCLALRLLTHDGQPVQPRPSTHQLRPVLRLLGSSTAPDHGDQLPSAYRLPWRFGVIDGQPDWIILEPKDPPPLAAPPRPLLPSPGRYQLDVTYLETRPQLLGQHQHHDSTTAPPAPPAAAVGMEEEGLEEASSTAHQQVGLLAVTPHLPPSLSRSRGLLPPFSPGLPACLPVSLWQWRQSFESVLEVAVVPGRPALLVSSAPSHAPLIKPSVTNRPDDVASRLLFPPSSPPLTLTVADLFGLQCSGRPLLSSGAHHRHPKAPALTFSLRYPR